MSKFFERMDGKTFLGAVILVGYGLLVNRVIGRPEAIPNMDLVKDQMLVIGPVVGMIAASIWRNTGADERRTEALIDSKNKLNDATTAIQTGVVPLALPSPATVTTDAVREGVEAGIGNAADQLLGDDLAPPLVRRPDGRAAWQEEGAETLVDGNWEPAPPIAPGEVPETEIME